MDIEIQLEQTFDDILFQLSKGMTIDKLKQGKQWFGFEQLKDWKNRMGYKIHIYSNDHFIENKPHFHLINKSEKVDCKFDFFGNLFNCLGNEIDSRMFKIVEYYCSDSYTQKMLIEMWNHKNPNLIILKI